MERGMRAAYQTWMEVASREIMDLSVSTYPVPDWERSMQAVYQSILGEFNLDKTTEVLSEGLAISPQAAARCLNDMERTRRFAIGLNKGIKEAMERFPGEKIKVLYAGCGPYATLAIPQAFHFSPDEIEFVLIDYHQYSLDRVKKIVKALGLEKYFVDYIQADACNYKYPKEKPHVILAETMNRGLFDEPQASVTANLAPQLRDGGIFIPEKVRVYASFETSEAKPPEDIGTIFELTTNFTKRVWNCLRDGKDPYNVNALIQIPVSSASSASIYMETELDVFGDLKLNSRRSIITKEIPMKRVHPELYGKQLRFRWRLGELLSGTAKQYICQVEDNSKA